MGLAGVAGLAVGAAWRALPGLAGLGLVAYGAWLAWPPAGFMTAGVLVLADLVADRISSGRGQS
ncbi:hypothetical protein [Streptomyces sp. NPDC001914]|uniref:hypothetical protein n=1 Tax=Streptomyces sp. NPDC001914 TaxID=3364623 RepID=UPI0036AEF8FC